MIAKPTRTAPTAGSGERAAQHVEADGPEVQRALVEGLDVERLAAALGRRARRVAGLLPQTLADRVRRRLARPAEVAVELEAHERLGHVDVGPQERPGLVRVPGPAAPLLGALQAEVHADVEHDARGAHALRVEHAEPVAVVLEEAEVGHEALGVQGPALAVARDPAREAAPGVERVARRDGLAALQVVARDALVVDGRLLAPRVELGDARGHGPPHAPG